ncbi:hypothetical protein [Streptomyces sp. 351MFTsu5.1]|uniref:hypothetical protein n=1 Tax=Streptomyces sp. 351MFTsu5.1 TaxID=1172180 RepID=UPI00036C6603|nr:hypothetical protein [Streptomyces sp. 351MFTsu5.1]
MTNYKALYGRLADLSMPFDTDGIDFDEYLWDALYEYADEGSQIPEPGHIVEVANLWATSPEGYGSTDINVLGRLVDGCWFTVVAWSDTTEFGCRQGVDWRINDTRELAISQGLDKEARAHLGLALPGEEAAS